MKKIANYLKQLIVSVAVVGACALPASAQSVITQTVDGVSNNLNRMVFDEQINNAVSAMANDDIPNLFGAVNALVSGTGTVAVASRYPILGANSTQYLYLASGTTTNTGIVAFPEVYAATPLVFVQHTTYAASNLQAGASAVNRTNFTANGLSPGLTWMSIGVK